MRHLVRNLIYNIPIPEKVKFIQIHIGWKQPGQSIVNRLKSRVLELGGKVKNFRFLGFVLSVFLIVSCQNPSSQNQEHSNGNDLNNQADLLISETPPTETPTPTDSPDNPDFFLQTNTFENNPQFFFWIEPVPENLHPPVNIECWEKESTVYTPVTGLLLNNHCIIKTGDFQAAIVLYDGSYIFLDRDTIAQINISNQNTEILLMKGEIYNIVAPQPAEHKFNVSVANSYIEVKGTSFGVSLSDQLVSIFVNSGEIFTYRCQLWKNSTCMKMNQVAETMIPLHKYSKRFGETTWTEEEFREQWYIFEESIPDMSMAVSAGFVEWHYLDWFPDEMNLESSYHHEKSWLGNFDQYNSMLLYYIDDDVYNEQALDLNQLEASLYCTQFPSSCYEIQKPDMAIPAFRKTVQAHPTSTPANSDDTSSPADACSAVPAIIEVVSCYCGNTSSQGVWCEVEADGNPGQGWIPHGCTKALNLCP